MAYTRLNPDFTGMQNLTTSNISSGTIRYARYGRVVLVNFENLRSTSTGGKVIGTLPAGYRPSFNAQPYARDNAGAVAQCWVTPAGEINVHFSKVDTPYAGFGFWLIS